MCYYSSAQQCLLTQLEGCCCKIQQCPVSPSYNALLQKQQFAPIHHHIMLCFTICCTTIHCFVAPSYNIPYYTPLQCSFASTYNSLLHPFKMHCCTLLQCSVAPSYKSLLPHHTMPCCIMIQWSVLHNQTMHCWTIILHHHSILCCTISQCSVAQTTMLCCTFIRCTAASSYNSLLHHHIAVFHLIHHHTMLGCNVIHCLFFVPSFTDLLQQHTMLQCTCTVKLAITKTTLSWHCSILSYEGLKMRLCRVMPYVSFNAFFSFCKWPFIPYRHNNKQ